MNVKIFYDAMEKSTKVQLIEDLFVRKNVYSKTVLFQMDGSIPRIFWRVFSPFDARYLRSYIQHDFIYATGLRDRKSADVLLRKGLEKARYEFYR